MHSRCQKAYLFYIIMFDVVKKLDSLVLSQNPVEPNSVSLKQLTDEDAMYAGKTDPVNLFDVLAVCIVRLLVKVPDMKDKPARDVSKDNMTEANVWMAALGYQADVGQVPEGAMSFPIDDQRGIWFRHADNLGEDVVSWCSDRSLVKHLSAVPTVDGPFAWYPKQAAQPDQQDIAARDLMQQLREAAQFYLNGIASPDWLWKAYPRLEPHMTSCLIKTKVLTKEEFDEERPFMQGSSLKPVLFSMDADEQHFLLIEVNEICQDPEGPVDDFESMMKEMSQVLKKPNHTFSAYKSGPGSPMKRFL